jgi:uncharacterized protein (DUF58 family)
LPGPLGRRFRVDTTKETQFSDSWLTLAVLLLVIGLVTQIGGLIIIAGLLVLVAAAGWLWDWLSLQGIEYRREFGERRAFVGETVDLRLAVVNRKPLPVGWLRLIERVPSTLPVEGVEVMATSVPTVGEIRLVLALRWYEQVIRSYRLHCQRRGFYAFGPVEMEAGDIFGLFSRKRRIEAREWLIVYPRVESLADLGLPPKEPFGPVKASTPLFEDPIRTVGVRDHRAEDGFRRIHWKATARRQQLQSRVYEPATGHNLVLMLNVATLAKHWQGYIPEQLERVVSVAASIAAHAGEQRWPVGIIANGALPASDQAIKVLPGRSPGQLTRIMEALAAVSPVATQQIEDLIRLESPRLPWGCTLVVITALVTPQLRAGLADLAAEGRRLVLVTLEAVAEDDPLLRGVVVRQVAGEPAGGEVVALPEQLEGVP